MISLEMKSMNGELQVRFDVPDKQGEILKLTELALFSLHLDVVKQRLIDLTNRAIAKGDGYDLVTSAEPEAGAERHA